MANYSEIRELLREAEKRSGTPFQCSNCGMKVPCANVCPYCQHTHSQEWLNATRSQVKITETFYNLKVGATLGIITYASYRLGLFSGFFH